MTTSSPVPIRRRRVRLAAGLVAGAVLAVGAPLAAAAHVHVSPGESPAGTSTRLAFTFSHGCEGSPTTALRFDLPEGIDAVTPVLDGAWTIAREVGDDGIATRITYNAAQPVEDGVSATVAMDVIFASDAADTEVAFPVVQECAEGETGWVEVADEGQDPHDLEAPAPVVAVGAVAAAGDDHDDHGDDHAGDHGDADDSAAAAADPVARWLAAGGLVAGLAALGVALFRRRA